jgi:hypothetical protein
MTAIAPYLPPIPPSLTLDHLCEELTMHLDSLEMTEPDTPERAECESAIALYMEQLPRKVDRVGAMLGFLESQKQAAANELKRLAARKQFYERSIERLEGYIAMVLEKQPQPKRGGKRLEGVHTTLSLRPSEAVEILNEEAIPIEYKTACVEMQATYWEFLADLAPDVLQNIGRQDLKVRKDDIKRDLKAGQVVAGARLETRQNVRLT